MNLQNIVRLCARNQQLTFFVKTPHSRVFLKSAFAASRFPAQFESRLVSTEAFDINKRESLSQTTLKKVKLQFRKYKLRVAGFKLYESIADQIDYAAFMTKLEMPDTFNSWFMLTELHVWMLMARLMANPYEGRTLRNFLVEALWKDVTTRSKKLGSEHMSIVRTQIYELNEGFQAALVLYDEGLLSNDKILASALWRRFYNQDCKSAHHLEAMIHYVRHSMQMLDSTELEDLIDGKKLHWIHIEKVFEELKKK
uniref:Ubiquinol-cytochrome c reductase complex chaperone CBP3 n=1 Tax=Lygus hesperus TaxID=30085 RepID=A0A0A9Z740_LYGHE